jgi:hypothetical protein
LLLCVAAPGAFPDDEPPDAAEMVNALLSGLLGFREMSAAELQREVADVGGVPFRSDVPLDYMNREELARYLSEVFDAEYPASRAASDARTLLAFDLLPPGVDLRGLRARLLQENIAGFYDERPGKRRLYAVSRERTLTPSNQLIMAHELRHALQDQYMGIHALLADSVGDFDDRRLALASLLEGDATFVMERFLVHRLPATEPREDLGALSLPDAVFSDVPPVVREQLVRPYIAGRDFARALWKSGGWEALKAAWGRPPESSEQVLHPEKYLAHEPPQEVAIRYAPPAGELLNEGVLGEMLIRALLGEENEGAASGWGGDRFRVWDISGKTLLVWRAQWDSPEGGRRFLDAARARYLRSHGPARNADDWALYERAPWTVALAPRAGGVILVASDDSGSLQEALRGTR